MALERFAEEIWIADGPKVWAALLPFPTRMIVVRLGDGTLWINSPIAAEETLDDIKALGPVRHLVAPTPLHAWRLDAWRALFPEAQVWRPPANDARGMMQSAFAAVAGIAKPSAAELVGWNVLGDVAPAAWARDLDQVVFRGNAFVKEVEFLHKPSGTLIVGDFIQNYRAVPGDALGNYAKRAADVLDGGVPRDIQRSMKYRRLALSSLRKILSWDFDRLIVAHGFCVEREAKTFVEEAFRWLSP